MKQHLDGYISMVTVTVLLGFVLVFTVGIALQSMDAGQTVLQKQYGLNAQTHLQNCVSEALYQLNQASTVNALITLPEGTCTVAGYTAQGSNWNMAISTTLFGSYQAASISGVKSPSVAITGWQPQ